jgi:hypothetical protein
MTKTFKILSSGFLRCTVFFHHYCSATVQ